MLQSGKYCYQGVGIRWAIRPYASDGRRSISISVPTPTPTPCMHRRQADEATIPEYMHGAMKQKQALCAAMLGDEVGMRVA